MKIEHTKCELKIIKMNYPKNPKEIITGLGIELSENYYEVMYNIILPDSDKEYIKQHEQIKADAERIIKCWNMHDALIEALKEIAKGEGAYDMDKLKHAFNTIENMKSIANELIEKATK